MNLQFGTHAAKREVQILAKLHKLTKMRKQTAITEQELMAYLKPPLQYDYRALADLKAYGLIAIKEVPNDYSLYTITEKGKSVIAQLKK